MPYLGRKFYKNTHFIYDFLDKAYYNECVLLDPIQYFHTEINYESYIYTKICRNIFNAHLLFKQFLLETKLEDEILKNIKP